MEIQINLTKDECDYLLNIVSYYQCEFLGKSWKSIRKLKYKTAKGFYTDKESFDNDMKNKKEIIKQQILDVEKIYEKIINKMEEELYE